MGINLQQNQPEGGEPSPSPGCGEERTKGGKTSAEKQQIKS